MSHEIRFFLRPILASGAMALAAFLSCGSATAAGPVVREILFDFDDPSWDEIETQFMSDSCGYPVFADMSGKARILQFDDAGNRSVQQLTAFQMVITYTNPATGATARLTDAGPDRIFIRDGKLYYSVSGLAHSWGLAGHFVMDLATEELVHLSGVGLSYPEQICEKLSH